MPLADRLIDLYLLQEPMQVFWPALLQAQQVLENELSTRSGSPEGHSSVTVQQRYWSNHSMHPYCKGSTEIWIHKAGPAGLIGGKQHFQGVWHIKLSRRLAHQT